MHKLVKQVSIESPGSRSKDHVFHFDVPMPEVPLTGARVRVVCAGVCYRRRDSTSTTPGTDKPTSNPLSITSVRGVRDTSLFPGYEAAGVVDCVGEAVGENCHIAVGDRVIIYPYEGIPHGYTEYISVPDVQYLVKLPDSLEMAVAAMLPTGALMAKNAVFMARRYVDEMMAKRPEGEKCKILIVGTGGLALWTLRIANYHFGSDINSSRYQITVAALRDDGISHIQSTGQKFQVVQWSEELHESQVLERTREVCGGNVDIIIDFGTTTRSILRSLQILTKGGVLLIGSEISQLLKHKFEKQCEDNQQTILAVETGSLEQLQELVVQVASGEVKPPPYTVFPSDKASEVLRMMTRSEIAGRAILKFDLDSKQPNEIIAE